MRQRKSSWRKARCPRCRGRLRAFADDLGALSRADNRTVVCGECGADEAYGFGAIPRAKWPVPINLRLRRMFAEAWKKHLAEQADR